MIILIASLVTLIALTVIGFVIFTSVQNPYGWMSQMFGGTNSGTSSGMGGMMGGQGTQFSTNSLLPYYGVLFAIIIGLTVFGIVGIAYYLLYPQIRMGADSPAVKSENPLVPNGVTAYESVSKTLTEEERKIINVLNAHNGKYLQKYIRNETGLSRLKTHRIIARLADRGIVSLEKTGNTNQVFLANWLSDNNSKTSR